MSDEGATRLQQVLEAARTDMVRLAAAGLPRAFVEQLTATLPSRLCVARHFSKDDAIGAVLSGERAVSVLVEFIEGWPSSSVPSRPARPRLTGSVALWASSALVERDGFYATAAQVSDFGGPWPRARWAPLLVLDDLGGEHIGDNAYSTSQIDRLLTERIMDRLPTIVVSRLDESEIGRRYGKVLQGRLAQAGAFTPPGSALPLPWGAP